MSEFHRAEKIPNAGVENEPAGKSIEFLSKDRYSKNAERLFRRFVQKNGGSARPLSGRACS